jgi:hypothetical protein
VRWRPVINLCSVLEGWVYALCVGLTACTVRTITRITRVLTTVTRSHAPLLPSAHSYVETEHSKEGTNVQLSVRGKMFPAQVSSSDAVVYMCGEA